MVSATLPASGCLSVGAPVNLWGRLKETAHETIPTLPDNAQRAIEIGGELWDVYKRVREERNRYRAALSLIAGSDHGQATDIARAALADG